MTGPTRPTPEEARRALDEASGLRVVTDRDLRTLPRVLLGVGAAMAVLLLLIKALGDNPWGFAFAIGAYVLALAVLMTWQTTVAASPRGYGLRYGLGVAGASAMYGLGCALVPQGVSWSLAALLALLTFLPTFLGARSIARLGRTR
ncbi:hypothetical protein [Mobilicoccus pelagius]|uniref:Uncharacterized protein n=1 Tax=Mobilicoccus pelagius NBRC 104925 TaxID=1089455 RepID=H5UVQ0_9MICO|nr:hypothetical protein [Mobilicoccus pelagius]GAB49808.1 hypothetical protein MOPEL_135_00460 [Mobilicoccus pelagius NBRC 104925]